MRAFRGVGDSCQARHNDGWYWPSWKPRRPFSHSGMERRSQFLTTTICASGSSHPVPCSSARTTRRWSQWCWGRTRPTSANAGRAGSTTPARLARVTPTVAACSSRRDQRRDPPLVLRSAQPPSRRFVRRGRTSSSSFCARRCPEFPLPRQGTRDPR